MLQPTAPEEKDYDCVPFCGLYEREDMDVPDKLIELGLYPATGYESEEYFFLNTNGERCVFRGGLWYSGTNAGVFCLYGGNSRSNSSTLIGFRSAFVRYSGESDNLDPAPKIETSCPDHLPESLTELAGHTITVTTQITIGTKKYGA